MATKIAVAVRDRLRAQGVYPPSLSQIDRVLQAYFELEAPVLEAFLKGGKR